MPMPRPPRTNRGGSVPRLALALVVTVVLFGRAPAPAQMPDEPARQVTLFGVIATPFDPAVDPKLVRIAPQLRKLLPNHGFRLLGVQSKRLTAGQTVTC